METVLNKKQLILEGHVSPKLCCKTQALKPYKVKTIEKHESTKM